VDQRRIATAEIALIICAKPKTERLSDQVRACLGEGQVGT
jgi:hypothetical protein